jgi:hypothetical protein
MVMSQQPSSSQLRKGHPYTSIGYPADGNVPKRSNYMTQMMGLQPRVVVNQPIQELQVPIQHQQQHGFV